VPSTNVEVPLLHPLKCDVKRDLILFQEEENDGSSTSLTNARLSSSSRADEDFEDIFFIHWSPSVTICSALMLDIG
jgi:hypothetical protein